MSSQATQPAVASRATFAVAGVSMQVLLGVVYAWSVFRPVLAKAYGWSDAQTVAPYRYSLLFFAVGMIFGGIWQDRSGPRTVATAGGLLLGLGWALAALAGHTPNGLVLAYGCLAGIGTGFAYVTPIATLVKWFPDKRGAMVGLAVMGFGLGPLIFAPLLEALLGPDPARFAATLPRTFWILAALSAAGVTGAAQVFRTPPPGWRPAGWQPAAGSAAARQELAPRQMLRTWQFYALWLVYFLGSSVGLTAIAEASPLVRQMAAKGAAALSAGVALGVMSVFNGAGRLGWGSVSDRLGRRNTILAMSACSVFACLFLLRNPSGFWQLQCGLCLAAFGYGGYLALLPALTADYFGPKHVGANYGLVFTAWGLCGFLVPGYFAGITDAARAAGRLATGYNQIYLTLAAMAAACGLIGLVLRPPAKRA